MPTDPILLHELLILLWRDEFRTRQEFLDKAESEALNRLSRSKTLPPEERAYFKNVCKATEKARKKASTITKTKRKWHPKKEHTLQDAFDAPNDDKRLMRFLNERDRIYGKLATRRCDSAKGETPFEFALEQVVLHGAGVNAIDLRSL